MFNVKLERVELNSAGVRELLRSPGVMAVLQSHGRSVASRAGAGHRVESSVGRNRARVAVITDTFDARWNEATKRTLTRAVG